MDLWVIAVAANTVIAVAYSAIAITVFRAVHKSGQWRTNPLAVATGAIFLTCAAGHGSHVEHALIGGTDLAAELYDWHLTAVDVTTAIIGVHYWRLRGKFGALVRGASLFEDLAVRRQEALDIQDGVVQHLATAKMAFELGDETEGMRALERGLTSSRELIAQMSTKDGGEHFQPEPGQLRRQSATR